MRQIFEHFSLYSNDTETNKLNYDDITIQKLPSSLLAKFNIFNSANNENSSPENKDPSRNRRAENEPMFILTIRAYDLGKHLCKNLEI